MSMKYASDHPELRKRIKVLLDGKDVTDVCAGFDVEAQQVELYERNAAGKKIIDYVCENGHVSDKASLIIVSRYEDPLCPECRLLARGQARRAIYSGRVEVFPIHPADTDLRT